MKFRVVKTHVAVMALIFVGIFVFMPVIFYLGELFWAIPLSVLLWLFVIVHMVNNCVIKSLIISENGVKHIDLFKKYEMSWDEISIVGIGYIPIKAPGRPAWICLAADGVSCPMLNARMVNEKFFIIHHRKEVEEAILMYWKERIDGLNGPSDFEVLTKTKKRLT